MKQRVILIAISATIVATIAPAAAQTHASPVPPSVASAGVTQDHWNAVLLRADRLARELRISRLAVRTIVEKHLGASNQTGFQDSVARIEGALIRLAQYQAAAARHAPILPADLTAIRVRARAVADDGRISEAREIYAQLLPRAESANVVRRSISELAAESAQLASADSDFTEAAIEFGVAARYTAQDNLHLQWFWRNQQANQFSALAERTGNVNDLRAAVRAYEDIVLPLTSQAARPLDWATTQNDLAQPLRMLGELGHDAEGRRAIASLEQALLVFTRQDYPDQWSQSSMNLGIALTTSGLRLGDEALLGRGIEAIEAAIALRPRDRDPAAWARAQQNLAGAYQALGDARQDPPLLRRAVRAFDDALEVVTRDGTPIEWAQVCNNLGAALRSLARMGEPRAADRSVRVLRDGLTAITRDTNRLGWARTQANLGASLALLGESGNQQAFTSAFEAFDAALSVLSADADGQTWAMVQTNLADAYEGRGDTRRADEDYARALGILERARPIFVRTGDLAYLDYLAAASERIRGKRAALR